jgi:hypothetical protein
VMQFHAPQNATGCNKIFPNKHSLNSARLGKNSVKWGVFIPSVGMTISSNVSLG